ncbi:enoyl-CoA hydratase/isomerase family protein [Hyphomicrobium sp. CS1BSMeth3]|uniref:enoyl-CoA hydratase/isomerase family protein n=1 Tax=Hyphomicrobium sp. CS1BSMeth3 TaxID=1892844 RepID=UPI000931C118|nr:enoyl-CoA hydratase/isomerase family protein [Hyphomicrobium sp. CS1BSMeth3]
MTEMTDEVLIRVEGTAGRITLNRPKALNALTLGMVRAIWPALLAWKDDPAVELVILDGAGKRGLCAGGDVRWLYDSRARGLDDALAFWREEYALNALIHRYPKPFVPIMDGIVMGGGIGLSAHVQGGARIVTERSQLAMPETTIGLIPDVGGTWLLGRAPDSFGEYLGLVGERMHGAGTIFSGFADVFVQSAKLDELRAALCKARAADVKSVIAQFTEPPPHSNLADRADVIGRTFSAPTVPAILDALAREDDEWALKTREALLVRSPKAMAATLAAVRRARKLGSLEDALNVELRLCLHLFEDGEFVEGVRALLVDKDKNPRWNPPTLAELSDATVEALFAPLPANQELGLRAPN